MATDYNGAKVRCIQMLVSPQKDIVIFPYAKSEVPVVLADGTVVDSMYMACYFPIELKYPYSAAELADKIEQGIDEWDKHKCYPDFSGKNTMEEKYYGVKGFRKAVKGCLCFKLGWDTTQGKYVSFRLPTKRGYAYLGIEDTMLPDDADWLDFANAVIDFIVAK